jgi:hypothetical protein
MLTAQGFAAGRAQPQQQFRGTPYNPQQGQNFAGFGSQQGGAFSAWNPNTANDAQAQRPPAFQAQTFNFDGTQSQMPNFQQRDAFINNINTQLGQMQGQSWNQPMGAPQFNFPQMWGQAGQQVQQGFQNPFAGQLGGFGPTHAGHTPPASPQPGGGQFQDLFQQFGFTPPAGFMDALIQRLQGGGVPQGGPGGASLPPPDHRAAYEQQQRQQQVSQERAVLARRLLGAAAGTQASDSQIWQAFSQNQHKIDDNLLQSMRTAGMVSDQEADQLRQEMLVAARARSAARAAAGPGVRPEPDPRSKEMAAQNKWNQENGLIAQLPKRAQYAEFLAQRGVPPDEARQLAEQQYPVKTRADEISRLGALQADLGRQVQAAQGDPAERARLNQQANDIGDQIRALKGQPTRAEQQQAAAAKAQQAANRKAAQNTPEAPAAWAWQQVVATAQREGRRITPQEAELYTKMQQEQREAAAKKRSAV